MDYRIPTLFCVLMDIMKTITSTCFYTYLEKGIITFDLKYKLQTILSVVSLVWYNSQGGIYATPIQHVSL